MAVKHKKTLQQADGTDATRARPSDWNDQHDHPPFNVSLVSAAVTWTNMPSAATEFTGTPRTRYDLTHAVQVRLVVCTATQAGATNATLKAQYSTDQSVWSDLTSALGIATPVGVKTGSWETCPAGAKGDVFLRVLGQNGDGTLDPQFRNVCLQVR